MSRSKSVRFSCLVAMFVLTWIAAAPDAHADPPGFYVAGGIEPAGGQYQDGVFTWLSQPVIYGTGFTPTVAYQIVLHGPINSLGFAPQDRVLQSIFADAFGNLDGIVTIPYEDAATVNQRPELTKVPQPGRYQVLAVGPSYTVVAQNEINLVPQTIPGSVFSSYVNWPRSRGARDGWLDDNSPERTDPEWPSVWDERPIGFYATVAPTNDDPRNQPYGVSHHEFPGTHFAHDVNLHLLPDEEYRWVLGTANFVGDPDEHGTGRLELEWEAQNDGDPNSYGAGVIGLPIWAAATQGDRVYTVGRWVMDNGHPDSGDRTEIHPPRLLATMRKRDTAVPMGNAACMTRASRVDIYVSGHGGAANQYYDRLSAALDNDERGGGRVEDVVVPFTATWNQYFAYGPADSALVTAIMVYTGTVADVWTIAGPTGMATDANGQPVRVMDPTAVFPWVIGPEERPINDMDYDFDVPLPPAPPGATTVVVHAITHPEHGTAVQEQISYVAPDPATGLPTKAHIHLPYNGADNGIYARTLEFSWDKFGLPGKRFNVTLNTMRTPDLPNVLTARPNGPWKVWADLDGDWSYLSGLEPLLISRPQFGTPLENLEGASFDTWLDPDDSLRVHVWGYEAHDFEALYEPGRPAYEVGADIVYAQYIGNGDNIHLGAALFEAPPSPSSVGSYTIGASPIHYSFFTSAGIFGATLPMYAVDFTVTRTPEPEHLRVQGETDFGDVCIGETRIEQYAISNTGEETLDVASVDVTGAGYTGYPNPPPPYGLGGSSKLDVTFTPTAIDQGAGSIVIGSSDVCQPVSTIPLHADVIYPLLRAVPATTMFPPTVVGCSNSITVMVSNTGVCDLAFADAKIQGKGYSVDASALPLTLAPGASTELTVTFAPESVEHGFPGMLTLTSNDPVNPQTTLAFCGEGVAGGARILVTHDDGTPWPSVDHIKVTSHGVMPSTNGPSVRDVSLVQVDPPASCEPLVFDLDAALPPTDPADPTGSFYDLRVQIGRTVRSMNFNLGMCEFKQITLPLEPPLNRAQRPEGTKPRINSIAPR